MPLGRRIAARAKHTTTTPPPKQQQSGETRQDLPSPAAGLPVMIRRRSGRATPLTAPSDATPSAASRRNTALPDIEKRRRCCWSDRHFISPLLPRPRHALKELQGEITSTLETRIYLPCVYVSALHCGNSHKPPDPGAANANALESSQQLESACCNWCSLSSAHHHTTTSTAVDHTFTCCTLER